MAKRVALIFGAGKLGRGFVAEVLSGCGCRVAFVDADEQRMRALAAAGLYTIYKARRTFYETVVIEDFETLSLSQEAEIADRICEKGAIVALAVHYRQMEGLVLPLAMAIAKKAMLTPDEPLDILLCVNHMEAKATLQRALEGLLGGAALQYLHRRVGFVETVEMVATPEPGDNLLERDPFAVLTNGYPEMPADLKAFKGEPPRSHMVRLVDNIEAEAHRKMFSFNTAYAVAAYLGVARRCVYLSDVLKIPELVTMIRQALDEAALGLCGEFGFDEGEMGAWIGQVLETIDNPLLATTINRLGTDTPRKVGPRDRLVGPALLCLKHGGEPVQLCRAIAHAYRFPVDGDEATRAFFRFIEEEGIDQALERYSRLALRGALHRRVRLEYETLGGQA